MNQNEILHLLEQVRMGEITPADAVLPNPYPGLTRLTPLHFIDYGEGIRQLTMDDLPRLQQSGKMFCRKVVSGASDELARHIDQLRQAAD